MADQEVQKASDERYEAALAALRQQVAGYGLRSQQRAISDEQLQANCDRYNELHNTTLTLAQFKELLP